MAYKVERNVFLDGTEYTIGDVVELPNDDRTKSLLESGTLSDTNETATAQPADDKEVDNSTSPLSDLAADGPQEAETVPVAPETTPEQTTPSTPEAPASSETESKTSPNLHLG